MNSFDPDEDDCPVCGGDGFVECEQHFASTDDWHFCPCGFCGPSELFEVPEDA